MCRHNSPDRTNLAHNLMGSRSETDYVERRLTTAKMASRTRPGSQIIHVQMSENREREMDSENTSAQALVDHWSWAASKGLINAGTATALAIACRRVLETQDNWRSIDVKSLDADHVVRVFGNLKARELKPSSLRDCQQKFRRALAAYLKFLDDPTSWKYPTRSSAKPTSTTSNRRMSTSESVHEDSGRPQDHQIAQEYSYPFGPISSPN